MLIHELTENLASTIAKGAATAIKSAPTVSKIAPSAERTTELFARHRANIAQIEQLASNPRDHRAVADVVQRLKQFHSDLYDVAHTNSQNTKIVAEVNRLRDDLVPILRNMEVNANQPGATSILLQSTRQELVPVLNSRLRSLEALVKAAP
jgi:hypothetical protein